MIGFGKAVAGFSGKIFEGLLEAKTNNEIHGYIGQVKSEQEKYDGIIAKNPGMSIEDAGKARDTMITQIETFDKGLSTQSAKEFSKNYILSNKQTIIEKANKNTVARMTDFEHQKSIAQLKLYAETGNIDGINDIVDRGTGIHWSKELAPVIKEEYTRQANVTLQAIQWNAASEQVALFAKSGMSKDDFVKSIDTDPLLENLPRSGVHSKESLTHDFVHWSGFYKRENEAKTEAAKTETEKIISNLGNGTLDYKNTNEAVATINKMTDLDDVDKKKSIDTIYKEIRDGSPKTTNWKVANKITNDIYEARAYGKSADDVKKLIFKARFIDRDISQEDYVSLAELADKKYPPEIGMVLKSVLSDMGETKATIGTAGMYNTFMPGPFAKVPIMDELSRQQIGQYNKAITQWIDNQPDVTKVTPQQIQEQAVILGSMYLKNLNTPSIPDIPKQTQWRNPVNAPDRFIHGQEVWIKEIQQYRTVVGFKEDKTPIFSDN